MNIHDGNYLGSGRLLSNVLNNNGALLDATMFDLRIFEQNGCVNAVAKFTPIRCRELGSDLELTLLQVAKVDFYHDETHSFYLIERYTFFEMSDGQFYLSLDPYHEVEVPHEEDGGIFIAKEVHGSLILKNK